MLRVEVEEVEEIIKRIEPDLGGAKYIGANEPIDRDAADFIFELPDGVRFSFRISGRDCMEHKGWMLEDLIRAKAQIAMKSSVALKARGCCHASNSVHGNTQANHGT